jgi:hypothetical protein
VIYIDNTGVQEREFKKAIISVVTIQVSARQIVLASPMLVGPEYQFAIVVQIITDYFGV